MAVCGGVSWCVVVCRDVVGGRGVCLVCCGTLKKR